MLSLGLSEYEGGKAEGRLHSPNEMTGFRASADALGTRAGAAASEVYCCAPAGPGTRNWGKFEALN